MKCSLRSDQIEQRHLVHRLQKSPPEQTTDLDSLNFCSHGKKSIQAKFVRHRHQPIYKAWRLGFELTIFHQQMNTATNCLLKTSRTSIDFILNVTNMLWRAISKLILEEPEFTRRYHIGLSFQLERNFDGMQRALLQLKESLSY